MYSTFGTLFPKTAALMKEFAAHKLEWAAQTDELARCEPATCARNMLPRQHLTQAFAQVQSVSEAAQHRERARP